MIVCKQTLVLFFWIFRVFANVLASLLWILYRYLATPARNAAVSAMFLLFIILYLGLCGKKGCKD